MVESLSEAGSAMLGDRWVRGEEVWAIAGAPISDRGSVRAATRAVRQRVRVDKHDFRGDASIPSLSNMCAKTGRSSHVLRSK
ncbi:hypothetical protein Aple_095370 [Acrocarpospora pleiomorpha]|uniref:Uncharacterized protein n=1 Tax=Acrocarpospora pleiomorpha TaxID=90975 RepID=A0A5M3Y5T7_9ACTN|nr:hypothetical protein Aple_095370 [Acrocarpospora pleiomorpha]